MTAKLLLSIYLILFFEIHPDFSYSQYDDPNKDQIPLEFLDAINPQSVLSVVTDATGFDNFNIGTDFGEPHLVMNPNNPLNTFVAYNTNNAHYSIDGYNWSSAFSPSFTVSTNGDPVTAFDSLGNLFYENLVGGVTGTNIIKSVNGGLSFSTAVAGNKGVDKNWLAADQTNGPYTNNLYIVITQDGSNSNVRRSTNNGTSFIPVTTLNNTYPGMMVCVGANKSGVNNVSGGAVYIVTNTGSSAFAVTYNFYCSNDGGASFVLKSSQSFAGYVGTMVGGRHSVQNMRTRPYPMITADNSFGTYRGRLYIVYATNSPAGDGNKPNIYCRYSTDQGATWSGAILVNDNPNPTLSNQFFPATWCDRTTGRLYCKWFDTRLTPTNDSMDVYASYSDDGGTTWADNQRITTQKAKINCTTCGGGGTPRYQGDYDAINSNSKTSVMAWTDMRAGSFGSYTAYFPDFAMLASPSSQIVHQTNDSRNFSITVPAVKLFSDVSTFSATVSPVPATGSIVTEFVSGSTLSSYPGTLYMKAKTVGTVTPLGNYTITITGQGSNGTPVHKRTVTLTVGNTVSAAPCEDFSGVKFPPASMYEEYSGTNYWSRDNVSAYASGSGSAKFDFYNAQSPNVQSIVSNNFTASSAGTYLTFDHAYAPFADSASGPDTLVIETSSDFGLTYSSLVVLLGKYDGNGELNTAPPNLNPFTPDGSEWKPKIFSLPVGTNKIRLTAKSGYGNNLYLDNICVQTLASPVAGSIVVGSQGMWIDTDPYWRLLDTVRVYLCRTDFPNVRVDSAKDVVGSSAMVSNLFFNKALTGSYYRVVKHRNSIETWSNAGIPYTRGSGSSFDFIQPDGQAYGNNQAVVSASPLYRGMYSGDVNQDNSVDLSDLAQIENAASIFLSGYVVEDLTGDNFVDLSDLLIADNNAFSFVVRIAPPGAKPKPKGENIISRNLNFENDAMRKKYESGITALRNKKSRDSKTDSEKRNTIKEHRISSFQRNKTDGGR
jgi:hypothetical protein